MPDEMESKMTSASSSETMCQESAEEQQIIQAEPAEAAEPVPESESGREVSSSSQSPDDSDDNDDGHHHHHHHHRHHHHHHSQGEAADGEDSHHHHHHHHHSTVTTGNSSADTESGEAEEHHHHHHHNRYLTKIKRYLSVFFHRLAQFPFAIVLLLLGVMPLIYNGGESWWLPLVLLVLIAAYGLWMMSAWWCGGEHKRVRYSHITGIFLLPLVVGLIQLVPSEMFVRIVSNKTWQRWTDFTAVFSVMAEATDKVRYTLSLSPDNTFARCLLFFICLLIFVILMSKAHHRLHLKLLMLTIVLTALGNALIAYSSFFSGNTGMAQLNTFRGTFLNRNHFGFMMMMGCMACAGLLAAINSSSLKDKKDWAKWKMLTVPLGLTMFILVVALVLSLSRGAFIAAVVSLLSFWLIWLKKGHEVKRKERQKVMSLMLMIACVLAVAMPYAMTSLADRYENLAEEKEFTLEGRWFVWMDTLRMIKDNWFAGVGLGAYGDTIQQYESGHFPVALIGNAHSDVLELTSEIGVPLMLLFLIGGGMLLWKCLHRCWRQHDRTYRWTGLAALMAVFGGFIHENFDFNLQAWPNAIVMTGLLAVAAISGRDRSIEEKPNNTDESRRQNRHERYTTRLIWLPVSILIMAMLLPWQYRKFCSALAYQSLAEEMAESGDSLGKGRGDYQRCLAYAENARYGYGGTHGLLKMTSALHAEYASLYSGLNMREQRRDMWKKACRDIALSCRRSPMDGETALMCARIFEQGNLRGARFDEDSFVISLYQRAINCQPTIRNTASEAAFAMTRFYRKSLTVSPQDSESYRVQSLEMLNRLLDLQPKGSRQIFAALSALVDDFDELVKMAPDNYDARSTLMEFLEDGRQYATAAKLSELMLRQLPAAVQYEGEQTAEKMRLFLYSHLMYQYEMLGEDEKRQALWNGAMQAATELNLARDWSDEVIKDNEALNRFRSAARYYSRIFPQNAENIIHEAQVYDVLARPEDMVATLLPLTYMLDVKPSLACLNEARKMLDFGTSEGLGVIETEMVGRLNYVRGAINVLIAEQEGDENLMQSARQILAHQKETQGRDRAGVSWLQRHMLDYYLGRACENLGEKEEAVASYRKCLDNCPGNYFALQRMQALKPEAMTRSETELYARVTARKSPIALLNNGLLWTNIQVTPHELAVQHARLQAKLYLVVTGVISSQPPITLFFSDSRGTAFKQNIIFKEDEFLTWKVGQILTVEIKLQPSVSTLSFAHRVLRSGTVTVKSNYQAIPIPATKAFEVKL